MSSVDSEEAFETEATEPGEAGDRPSLATTPGGRRELHRDLLEAMARQGVMQPTSENAAASAPVAPVSTGSTAQVASATAQATAPVMVPPRTPRAASGSLGVAAPASAAPAPMPAAPAPAAPPGASAANVTMAMPSATHPLASPSTGFQQSGAGVAPPTAAVSGAVSASGSVTSTWPAPTRPSLTTLSTPRGAIPSYGGVTIGTTPLGYGVSPPVLVPPPTVPVVPPTTSSGVPAVSAAMPAIAGTQGLSLPQWWSQVRAQMSSAPAVAAPAVPMLTTVPMTSQPAYYGSGTPYGSSVNTGASRYAWPVSAGGGAPVATTGPVGIRSSVKNAVDMINPFYSDGYTVERARTFWAEFERITRGMDDDLRMTVFRGCMKVRSGENWWSHSRITDFATLRVRFHNRFLCISPLQMMEKLKTTKRSRGESVEEWADRIRDLCDEASIFDPLMRYQYFLTGIRNSAWTVALQTTMVNSIEEAVTVLLFKKMQIPVERDEDFKDDSSTPKGDSTTPGQLMNMMQQMQTMMAQQQQMLQAPRSPRGRPIVAPVQAAPVQPSPSGVPGRQFVGISMAADQRTQEGVVVCGRCNRTGHGRATCPRQHGSCRRCQLQGHYSMECTVPTDQLPRRNNGGNGQGQQARKPYCVFCKGDSHATADCPLVQVLRNVAAREAQNVVPATAVAATPARQ